jgi:hypothetical protein
MAARGESFRLSLRLPQCEMVGLLVLLDNAFERAVLDICVIRLKKQQSGQYPRQRAVPILKRIILRNITMR